MEATPEARPALEAWVREHGTIEEAAASHPDAQTLTGRGRVYVVPAPTGAPPPGADSADGRAGAARPPGSEAPERWVVRHYHRGGAIARVLGDRYLRLGPPRPLRELRIGRALEERGVPTPAHIGAAVYPSGLWYRGDLVTRYVPGSRDLAAVLFPGRTLKNGAADARPDGAGRIVEPEAAVRATGRLFRRLHEDGVVHPDLNLKNVLIRKEGGVVDALVLDLDGARLVRRVGGRARRRMVKRFWRSARKWQAATGVELEPELKGAFEVGYEA